MFTASTPCSGTKSSYAAARQSLKLDPCLPCTVSHIVNGDVSHSTEAVTVSQAHSTGCNQAHLESQLTADCPFTLSHLQ